MTRTNWSLVGGLIMSVWFLMPLLLATAGTMADPKPASSGRPEHDPRCGEGDRPSHLSQPGPGPDQPVSLLGGAAV